mmetsp:Transcript_24469/g.64347  ORF Transcript_24469/g.64347 Transcript_24469/m.64347 type:complete len:221 (-) Transcript_24469:642-1304(-)
MQCPVPLHRVCLHMSPVCLVHSSDRLHHTDWKKHRPEPSPLHAVVGAGPRAVHWRLRHGVLPTDHLALHLPLVLLSESRCACPAFPAGVLRRVSGRFYSGCSSLQPDHMVDPEFPSGDCQEPVDSVGDTLQHATFVYALLHELHHHSVAEPFLATPAVHASHKVHDASRVLPVGESTADVRARGPRLLGDWVPKREAVRGDDDRDHLQHDVTCHCNADVH